MRSLEDADEADALDEGMPAMSRVECEPAKCG